MAMEVFRKIVNKCIQTENNNEYEINAALMINDIVGGYVTFHQFIECLGEYLTDVNVDGRARGIKLLSAIIIKLPADFLKEAEVHMLTIFLCDRVADHESVSSKTLKGLHNLLVRHRSSVTRMEIGLILKAIFQDFFTQTRILDDRHCVFLVFQTLLQTRLDAIKSMGFDFVSGFIQAIDGEKDPRNLTLVFQLLPVVISNFDIELFVEQLFEVTACYFPIDYSPSHNDRRGISREDLVLGLRSCLASTPRFAEHCLPLLLEKMESDLESAKLDTFQTLETCAEVYGCDGLKEFYSDIWKGIRREVFSNSNSSLENAALQALTAVIKAACQGVVQRSKEDALSRLVSNILEESVSYLIASDMNLIGPTTKLLSAIAMASVSAYDLIAQTVVPLFLEHYATAKELPRRKLLVDSLSSVLDCRQRFQLSSNQESPLNNHKSALLALYFGAIETSAESALRLPAIHGLLSIATIPTLLTDNEIECIAKQFAKCATHETEESHRLACLNALAKLVTFPNSVVTKSVINDVLSFFEDALGNQCGDGKGNVSDYQILFDRHLHVLTAVVEDAARLMAVTPALLTEFRNALNGISEWKWAPVIVCFIRLAKKQELTQTTSDYWCQEILLKLIELAITQGCHSLSILEGVAAVNLAAVPYLDSSDALKLVHHILKPYSNIEFLDSAANNHPMSGLSPSTIIIDESILNSVKAEIFNEETQENLHRFLMKAIAQVEEMESSEPIVLSASRSIASILNKLPEGEYLSKIMTVVFQHVRLIKHQPDEIPKSRKHHLIHLLTWATKAVVIRGHPSMEQFSSELLKCLEDESISELTASGFQAILSESERALNVRCHANIRLLYKQRFFLTTCPRLIDGFNTASEGTRYNFLTALVHLASCLSKEIFMNEVPSMLPLFVKGLLSDSSSLLVALLSTLSELMADSTDFAELYADTLIPHLLRLSTFKSTMAVRIKALTCVGHLTKLPLHVCIKHKQDVVVKLGEAIDDPKRLVRNAATTARSSWFLVGS